MSLNNSHEPSLGCLLRKTLKTGLGALHNRGELFVVELQEESWRLLNLIIRCVSTLFLGMMAVLLLTGTLIFVTPQEYRLYAALGFSALYLGGAVWAFFSFKALLKEVPFNETTAQFKKDRDLPETFQ